MTNVIGARIKALREERKLSQDELARIFGFKDRQIVSAIETGTRRVSAEELLLAVEKLGASLDYFTDPFRLVGEGRFNWRQSGVPVAVPGDESLGTSAKQARTQLNCPHLEGYGAFSFAPPEDDSQEALPRRLII